MAAASDTTASTGSARRRRRWPWVVLGVLLLLVGVFYIGGGLFFSGQIRTDGLDASPYDPAEVQTGVLSAVELDRKGEGSVTMALDGEFADDAQFDRAVVGLKSGDTLMVAGPATSSQAGVVTRPVTRTIGAVPQAGDPVGLVRDVWLDPQQAGLEFQQISVAGPTGTFPAWVIPAKDESTKWAVLTHGLGASRSEMIRMSLPLHAAGFNVLLTTYTNDDGAPKSSDGLAHFGATEWRDLEAAVRYALDQGATKVVLGGASHGGAVTLGFMRNSELRDRVDALVLDSPASSFRDVVDASADERTLPVIGAPIPESLEDVALFITAKRYGIDFGAIDYSGAPGLLQVPVLLFQGEQDKTVMKVVNDRFAAAFPDKVTYVVVPGAGHVASWNLGPEQYESRIQQFLAENQLAG